MFSPSDQSVLFSISFSLMCTTAVYTVQPPKPAHCRLRTSHLALGLVLIGKKVTVSIQTGVWGSTRGPRARIFVLLSV